MTTIIIIFAAAFSFSFVSTPLVRKLAIRSGFIAIPKADRAHTEPTALMGGLAIYSAAIAALLSVILLVTIFLGNALRLPEFLMIVLGASMMAAIGLWDDRRALPAGLKLALQFIPAILVFFFGVKVQLPLGSFPISTEILNFVITICWILFITNALNYLDNADGVAVMTSATTSAIFLLIAILNEQRLVSILAAAVSAASLGFARYNLPLPKSTIFMGDSGSLFLGYLIAILGIKIRIPSNDIQITWMVPIIVLGLPIFDTTLVFISRTRRRISFFRGGVDHTTHRLARLGMDKLSVALAVSLISGALGLVAIFVTRASLFEAYFIAATLLLIAGYTLWRIEFKATHHFRTGADARPSLASADETPNQLPL
ncbi:MAG: undecaprenyl/decaprenyl-phosphate alpha-N-acetylglucosaminyl 1-phosphate transferase [Anaerolineae bacterium]|nr:undecaprenyl/decaprenyl-phosphate alpha-N-acetylglucosaminyl 1-phosphate transferase [Anaerolineae bacterium]